MAVPCRRVQYALLGTLREVARHPMALPPQVPSCPPKCSCRSQAAHGFQRDMPSHLGVRVALEYVFYGPLGGSALPKQGGVE